jgi:hypothetical protein
LKVDNVKDLGYWTGVVVGWGLLAGATRATRETSATNQSLTKATLQALRKCKSLADINRANTVGQIHKIQRSIKGRSKS